jgi:hypothetical protein
MAERVAICGLDDPNTGDGISHYLPLQGGDSTEPFQGHRPAAPRTRRVECLAHAHREARERLLARIAELRTRPSASTAEVAVAEAALSVLGDAPRVLAPNSDEQWHAVHECDLGTPVA